MNYHDKKQIKKLLSFKEWALWYRALSEEEKEKERLERWKDKNKEKELLYFFKKFSNKNT